MSPKYLYRMIPALLWTLALPAATAEDTLSPVVVTASRTEADPATLPWRTDSLSRVTLQQQFVRSMPEALEETTAIMVQKTGHGQGSPFIRGFTSYRNLFLIDGIRLNNSVFRDGPNQYWNTVDVYAVDRLEVVKGPASTLYGSDAIGGTVNVLTTNPFDLAADSALHGRVLYRGASAERSHTLRSEVSQVLSDTWAFRGGVTLKEYDDLESGGSTGRLPKTGYDEAAFDAQLAWQPTETTRLTLAHQSLDQDDAWRTHKTVFAKSFSGSSIGNEQQRVLDQDRHLTYLRLEHDGPRWAERMQWTVSHHQQSESQDRIRQDGRRDIQGFLVDTFGASVQAHSLRDSGAWSWGAAVYHDDVSSFRNDFRADGSFKGAAVQGPVGDDATYDTAGIWLQNRRALSGTTELTTGVRGSWMQADVGRYLDPQTGDPAALKDDWTALTGNIRLLQHLDDARNHRVYVGLSQGFRAPNLSDLTRLDSARSDELETAAPGLDPEQFLAGEIGFRGDTGRFGYDIAGFATQIDDLIVRTPTGVVIDGDREVTKANASEGWVAGVELSGEIRWAEAWTAWTQFTWMDGEADAFPTSEPVSRREPLTRIMPLTSRTGIRYTRSQWWVETLFTLAERADRLSSSDRGDTQRIPPGGTPGYGLVTLRGGWQATERLALSAALENLADKSYRVHGSGLNEPGRNAVVQAEWRW